MPRRDSRTTALLLLIPAALQMLAPSVQAACPGGQSPVLGSPTTFSVVSGNEGLAVADFNSDGILDLVTSNLASNSVSVLLAKGQAE